MIRCPDPKCASFKCLIIDRLMGIVKCVQCGRLFRIRE